MEPSTMIRDNTLSMTMPGAWLAQMLQHGQREVFGVTAVLTPELADILLQKNACNRPLRPATVKNYARMMQEDKWALNGETIIISQTGELNTGQHRCHAVIASGKAIQTCFSFGVSRSSRTTTDSGRIKTAGDRLGMMQIEDGRTVSAIAALLWQIDTYKEIPLGNNTHGNRPTAPILDDIAARWEKTIRESMAAVPRRGAGKIASFYVLTFAHLLFRQGDSEEVATSFIKRLVDGGGLDRDDPIFAARERLMEEKVKGGRVGARKQLEITIRAWNMHRKGQKAKFIRVTGEWPEISA